MKRLVVLLVLSSTLVAVNLAGAATASATALCKTATNPCGSKYGVGTAIEFKAAELSWITTGYAIKNECRNVVIRGEVTNAGGSGVNVSATITKFVVPECNHAPVLVPKPGAFSIKYTEGNSGTLTLEGFEIEEGFVGCSLGGPTSFNLPGGSGASFIPSSSLLKISGLCPLENPWDIRFKVLAPETLYVEPS